MAHTLEMSHLVTWDVPLVTTTSSSADYWRLYASSGVAWTGREHAME